MKKLFIVTLVLALGQALGQAAERFDFHTIRKPAAAAIEGLVEGEFLKASGRARPQDMRGFGAGWSGDAHLLWDGVVGDKNTVEFSVEKSGRYTLVMQWTLAPDYGQFEVRLNGKVVEPRLDLYSPDVRLAKLRELGELQLIAGTQRIEIKLTGANAKASKYQNKGYLYGLDYLKLTDSAPKPMKVEEPEQAVVVKVDFAEARALMKQHCFRCHGAKKVKGKVNLEALAKRSDVLKDVELARHAAEALAKAEMPPEDEPQPAKGERAKLAAFFEGVVDEYVSSNTTLEPVVMRRLNRYEYNNAVRDLLELRGDIYPLPEKVIRSSQYFEPASGRMPAGVTVGNRTLGKFQVERQILSGVDPFAIDLQAEHGFNNQGEQLSIPPILLESLLKLGRSIVNAKEFDDYTALRDTIFKDNGKPLAKRLRPFLERAFRSPVDEATLARYTAFHTSEQKRTGSYTTAMKSVVAAMLASPKFIYVVESKQGAGEKTPANDYELAQRLALFLWSSIPDEPLLAAAREGHLRQPAVLETQVRRMLNDRRSRALSENFARQWLRLDQLITAVPDFDRFQVYYSRIGCEQWKFGLQTMVEPLLLFESVQVEDRSIMLFVDSNYAYRSDELQAWYNKPEAPFGTRGNRNRFNTFTQPFRKRQLTTRREGGVMTTAAVLTMTSTPLRTSPIKRGAWVATVMFNDPPPPPPDVVPEIEADDAAIEAKGLTIRERLKQHATDQSCASCHARIDPLGFVLESFDPIGRWRDQYRGGREIDASGKLFGEEEFKDIEQFKDAILARPEKFMRAFSKHLLSYALGRELKVTDKPAIDRITRRVTADHGRFSTVVVEIAKSMPFRHKTGQNERK
jgi:mono/diheme cytochrome c family protein